MNQTASHSLPPLRCGTRSEAGFLTAEAVIMIMVLVVLLPVAYAGWNVGFAALKARAVAQQLVQVSEAAKVYARSNGLLTSVTPGADAISISSADLVAANMLPNSTGPDLLNAWQQSYKIYYSVPATRPNVPAALSVVVVTVPPSTGGTVSESDARKAASFAGAGVVLPDSGGTDLYLHNPSGGWQIKLDTPALPDTVPTVGSIGTYASLDDKALNNDLLYRVSVPGRPELNQMHVDLDMRDKSVLNVGSMQFNATSTTSATIADMCRQVSTPNDTDGKVFYYNHPSDDFQSGLYACKDGAPFIIADSANSTPVRKAAIVDSGGTVDKPNCTGAFISFISVSPATVMVNGVTPPPAKTSIYSSYADDPLDPDNKWVVSLTAMDENAQSLAVTGSKLSVLTSCAQKP